MFTEPLLGVRGCAKDSGQVQRVQTPVLVMGTGPIEEMELGQALGAKAWGVGCEGPGRLRVTWQCWVVLLDA